MLFEHVAEEMMCKITPLKAALLIVLMSVGTGCAPDRAAEPEATGVDAATAAYLQGNEAFEAMDLDQALNHYDRALALDSTHAEAYVGRGRVFWFSLQFDRAVEDLSRALALNPNLPWAYYFRGISLMNLQNFERGIADLTEAIASEALPADFAVKAHHLRAVGHMNLSHYDDAIADVSMCIDAEPENPIYRYERATLYEAAGRARDAIADYESFLAIHEAALKMQADETDAPSETGEFTRKRMAEVRQKLAVLRGT